MGKTVAVKKHFTFVGGLNTEAGPLTFPENAWAEGDNVIPDLDGSASLRTGVDYEASYELSTAFTAAQEVNCAFVVAEWNNVGGNGNRHFLAVQRAATLSFYVNSGDTISNQDKSFTIDLDDYKAPGNPETVGVAPVSCANVMGRLLVCSRDTEPLLVEYDEDEDDITVTPITLKIRDLVGVEDDLDVDEQPNTLSDEHKYNLHNQGWIQTRIDAYNSAIGEYPANNQIWWYGKDSASAFDSTLLTKSDFGTTPAPKGRYILDLFERDRSTVSGVAGIDVETEEYRPTATAFFAGRAWYAGVRSSTIGAWVMFSQVAEDTGKLGKCYQDADPTSEIISDLVATDGGVVVIQDAGTVQKLVPNGNSLLVLCDNGVWQITGGESGFSALSYEVRRISAVGCVSAKSVVEIASSVAFWGDDDIYSTVTDQFGNISVVSVSDNIHTLYNEIPMAGRIHSSGVYVPTEQIVYWAYSDDESQDGFQRRFKKNRLLCFHVGLKVFYTMTVEELASLSPYIADLFVTRTRASEEVTFNVVNANGDNVVQSSNQVVIEQTVGVYNTPRLKFLAVHPASASSFSLTMAQFDEDHDAPQRLRDWYSKDTAGVSFDGYILPGYDFGADQGGDKAIQALYVMVFMRRTETGVEADGDPINPSSCTLRGRWDWTDSTAGNRWSTAQEVYRHRRLWLPSALPSATFDDGHPVVVTKNKVRGRGKALQLHFSSTADKDMQLLGWAITYIGNENV